MYGQPWASLPFAGSPAVSYPAAGASEKVVFMTGELSDAATLAAGTTVQMAAANLQDQQPAKKWRSAAATAADYLTVTFAEPVAANGLFFNASNFSDAAWLRVRGYRTAALLAAATVADVDSNWLSAWPLGFKPKLRSWPRWAHLVRWSNDAAYQYWRIDIADSAASGSYLEAGRLVLDRYWQPANNMDFEGAIAIESSDIQTRSPWGNLYTEARRSGRGFEIKFSTATWRDAFDLFSELQRRRGLAKDVVVILDPAATDDFQRFAIQGLITSVGRIVSPASPTFSGSGSTGQQQYWSFSITVSELLD